MRPEAAIFAALLMLGGCASASASARPARTTEGAAAPAGDLAGTWTGTAFAVPGSNYAITAPVELTIDPDGTWRWSKRGQQQAHGRVRVHGQRVYLDEDVAQEGAQTIELQRRSEHLWGLSRAFIPESVSAVDLKRAGS